MVPTEPILPVGRSGTLQSFRELRQFVLPGQPEPTAERELDTRYVDEAPKRPFVKSLPATDDELPLMEERRSVSKPRPVAGPNNAAALAMASPDFRAEVEPKDRDLIAHAKQSPTASCGCRTPRLRIRVTRGMARSCRCLMLWRTPSA